MKNATIILIFTVLVTLFYRHVGQLVPQKEVPAPAKVEVGGDMSTEEMVAAGEQLVNDRCMSCHSVQPRFPKLDGIGERAGTQREGYTDVEYLAETLYEPNAFIVAPYAAGMTAANKPPINLNDKEILTVIAYLQSLGGTPSVTMDTKLKYQSEDSGDEAGAAPAAAVGTSSQTGEELMTTHGCAACHSIQTTDRLVGPGLGDVGKRLSKGELYDSIMEPDAVVAEGYPPGMMGATLAGSGFYDKVTTADLKKMVDYLASLQGGK